MILFISLLFYSIAMQPGTIISVRINKVLSYLNLLLLLLVVVVVVVVVVVYKLI